MEVLSKPNAILAFLSPPRSISSREIKPRFCLNDHFISQTGGPFVDSAFEIRRFASNLLYPKIYDCSKLGNPSGIFSHWFEFGKYRNFYSPRSFINNRIQWDRNSSKGSIQKDPWKISECNDSEAHRTIRRSASKFSFQGVLEKQMTGILSLSISILFTITPLPIFANSFDWFQVSMGRESSINGLFDPFHHLTIQKASASGLVVMPPTSLNNTYYFVRAGESFWESSGMINTNPVAKTRVDNGLSPVGKKQSIRAANQLLKLGACDEVCWIWPSITQRAYQSAEIIAYANGVSYSRIVPEYSFLDARGVGSYEGKNLSTLKEIRMMDEESPNLRPPKYSDGTPNESVADVLVRVTQLISITETQYLGDTIIIISPDSDNLSILEAALTGLDLRFHSRLAYAPGEVRKISLNANIYPSRPSGLLSCTSTQCS